MDSDEPNCPLCPGNGMVEIVADNGPAYLTIPKESLIPGCYLIVPYFHVTDLGDLPNKWWPLIPPLLQKISWFMPGADFNLSLNVGPAAGQRLPHLHFWVIPRKEDAGPSYGLGLASLINAIDASIEM